MPIITFTGPDDLSPPVRLPGHDGNLRLPKNVPFETSDLWAACLLAAGPEFESAGPISNSNEEDPKP
jgi:hypothetical protein